MRLFVGIAADHLPLPEDTFKKLKINLSRLEFKLVPKTNLHITLNFLGEISEDLLPQIQKELSELCTNHEAFELKLSDLDAFPEIRKGRNIWIGVQNSIALRNLQSECEQRIRKLGITLEEREFKPHMTVARTRNHQNLKDPLSPYHGHKFGILKVDSVVLYESVLGGAFPVYKKLWDCALSYSAR